LSDKKYKFKKVDRHI